MELHDGMSRQKIADQFGIEKATVHDVIKAGRASVPAEQSPANAVPAKARQRAMKPAAALMAERTTTEMKHGQRRVSAV